MTGLARVRWRAGLLLAVAGLVLVAVGAVGASSIERTVVMLVPASQNAQEGDSVSVDVEVENVRNLAAFEFRINYDADVLEFDSVQESSFLGSTGRSVSCPSAVVGDEDVLFGCVTAGETTPRGVDGSGVLATVSFSAVGGGTSPLTFTRIELSDWNACDSWGIDNDGDGCFNEDPIDGADNDKDGQIDEDPPDQELLALEEAAVAVTAAQEPTPESLPPTPTPNPAALTPTAAPPSPTPGDEYVLPTPEPGEPGAVTQQPSSVPTPAIGSAVTPRENAAADGGQGAGEGFPVAGTGPPPEDSSSWAATASARLAALGLGLLGVGVAYQRLRRRSLGTDR